MSLDELQRIKQWHVRHRHDHPVEYHLFDMVLTLWLMGWVGLIPTVAMGAFWLMPVCGAAALAPTLYVAWRMKAHRARRLRCDWLRA